MYSLAPVVSNVESWGISRRTAIRTRNQPQIPRLSSVVWFTTPAMFIFETCFVLVAAVAILVLMIPETILVLVALETNPVLTTTLETNPVRMLILETVGVLKLTLNEMMKLSSMFAKMM